MMRHLLRGAKVRADADVRSCPPLEEAHAISALVAYESMYGNTAGVAAASFVLVGMTGSPYERVPSSELERAREWGRALADRLPAGAR